MTPRKKVVNALQSFGEVVWDARATLSQIAGHPACEGMDRNEVANALDQLRDEGHVVLISRGKWYYAPVPSEMRIRECRHCGGVPYKDQLRDLEDAMTRRDRGKVV